MGNRDFKQYNNSLAKETHPIEITITITITIKQEGPIYNIICKFFLIFIILVKPSLLTHVSLDNFFCLPDA